MKFPRGRTWPILLISFFACSSATPRSTPVCEASTETGKTSFGWSEPEDVGINPAKLLELTQWVQNNKTPIFSILISKNNRIVYELYTSAIKRDDAHYLMSVTKSVTSALVGVALAQHALRSTDQTLPDVLPNSLFPNANALEKFRSVTLKDVLGMSALDAQVAPHLDTPEAKERLIQFVNSPNRTQFALTQNLLPEPGTDFQYTDITPSLAAGAIEYNTSQTLLDLANQTLFGPMEFKNQEWMHEDAAGIDNGAYGLRLRPVDMQKFGMLYLNRGCWLVNGNAQQLLSKDWVEKSFQPWIKSKPTLQQNDYGYYWWHYFWKGGWTAHIASGWRGQRIAVFPEKGIVLTITADIEDGTEDQVFGEIFSKFVAPSVDTPIPPSADIITLKSKLRSALQTVNQGPTRISSSIERRMIPSQQAIDQPHHGLR